MVLKKSGNGWNFASETIWEDFVSQHLPTLQCSVTPQTSLAAAEWEY